MAVSNSIEAHQRRGSGLKRNHLKAGAVLACAAGVAYGAVALRTNEGSGRTSAQKVRTVAALETASATRMEIASVTQPLSTATTTALRGEPYRPCTLISSVPFDITAPGRYCYAANLVSPSFYGVRIEASDVELDCRGFSTTTSMGRTGGTDGISVINGARHATIQNCKVIGFDRGITAFAGSTYARIANNHVDASLSTGIGAWGNYAQITGNRVSNTHPEDPTQQAEGIVLLPTSPEIAARGQVVTNNVVVNTYGGSLAAGIHVLGSTSPLISGNSIMELSTTSGGIAIGLWLGNWAQGANTTGARITGNQTMSRNTMFYDVLQSGPMVRCDGNIIIGTLSGSACAGSQTVQ